MPGSGRHVELPGGISAVWVPSVAAGDRRFGGSSRLRSRPVHRELFALDPTWRVPSAERGNTTVVAGSSPSAAAITPSRADEVTFAVPCNSKRSATASRRSSSSASCQPSSSRAESRAAPVCCPVACCRLSAKSLRSLVVHQRSAPEVEQSSGDDVALDLGRASVDGGRPRVEVLRAPLSAVGVVAEEHLSARPSAARSKTDCSAVGEHHLVDRGLGARASRRRPSGTGWPASAPGTRTAARTPRPPQWRSAVRRGRSRAGAPTAGAGTRRGATARCCARTAAGPSRPTSPGRPRRACGRPGPLRRRRRPRRTPGRRSSSPAGAP